MDFILCKLANKEDKHYEIEQQQQASFWHRENENIPIKQLISIFPFVPHDRFIKKERKTHTTHIHTLNEANQTQKLQISILPLGKTGKQINFHLSQSFWQEYFHFWNGHICHISPIEFIPACWTLICTMPSMAIVIVERSGYSQQYSHTHESSRRVLRQMAISYLSFSPAYDKIWRMCIRSCSVGKTSPHNSLSLGSFFRGESNISSYNGQRTRAFADYLWFYLCCAICCLFCK